MEITRRQRDDAFWVIYMYSMLLDPVFLYVPVTKDDKKCFQFDTPLLIVGIAEHSLYVILFLMNEALRLRRYRRQNCGKYLFVLFDLSVILPLPEVLTLLAYNQVMSGQKFFSMMNLFLVQHGLKVIRLYALIKKERNSDDLTKWARFTFYLFFLHAANVIGASWYFFALQRKAKCWRKACTDSTGRELLPSLCNHSSRNYTCSNDFCSTKTQNATIYDFGIFHDAIKSGVMEQNNIFRRFFACAQWSMQNLSSFGQSLPLSTNLLENIFVISITITGVLLFFFLIGKVQIEMSKADKKRQKA